jgi:predicted metallo-beta-lactamase superfamily hydrolase
VTFVIYTKNNAFLIDCNAVRPGEQSLPPAAKKRSILSENYDGVVTATKNINVVLLVDSNIDHFAQVQTIWKLRPIKELFVAVIIDTQYGHSGQSPWSSF